MSRDMLEDFDLFDLRAGYYCDVEAVAVEATPEEIANDPGRGESESGSTREAPA